MKKNDKIIIGIGIIVLLISSTLIYLWVPPSIEGEGIKEEDIFSISGTLTNDLPSAIEVSSENPFYALIATPLAIHYDKDGKQQVIPLYVKNLTNPSKAITRAEEIIGKPIDACINGSESPRKISIDLAKKYWSKSEGVLLIKNDQDGYNLGVVATPIASYLSIPIIVTDTVDGEIYSTLRNLGVRYYIICGNLSGGDSSFRFDSVEDIVNFSIELVQEKFGDVEYITLTNPIDAWPPKVLDSKDFYFGPDVVKSASMNTQNMIKFMMRYFSGVTWDFKIPDDYKYALVEFDGYNHEIDGVDKFGDCADFSINSLEDGRNIIFTSTRQGTPVRDGKGNLIEDKVHSEIVLYDCGGRSYRISAYGRWTLKDEGKVSAHITIKKLEHPRYEMMKSLSSIAPYLTAYHKGIIFAKPDFAFTADDDVITDEGKTCLGVYLPGRNPELVPMSNKHVYDKIHEPLNRLLAKLAGISYGKTIDLKYLTEYYKNNPVYIALVGGTAALPRYLYQNEVEPIGDIDGDGIDDTVGINFGGGGTNSDNIYADIDPVPYEWSNKAQDIYSNYPFLENIVGRITGWDVQDANAQIVRTIFYGKIIKDLTEWKNHFGNLFGGGIDFRKPLWVQILNHIPGLKQLFVILDKFSAGFVNFDEGPWKYDTGFSRIMAKTIEDKIGKELGFKVKTALHESSILEGLSDEAINEIKKANLWTRLTFSTSQVKNLVGKGNVEGREILENSNFIWLTGHGCPYNFGLDSPDLVASGFDGIILNAPNLWQKILKNTILPHFVGGFWGPGGWLGRLGEYNT
ncbi:MAG: hypothetical protein DRN12_01115, partial [Thermoplasmata archaeon]